MNELHIALLGCGGWGKLILRDLKKLGARVTVVALSKSDALNACLGNADYTINNIDKLPNTIDGAIVATPSNQHAICIDSLLPRCIPIFVEKPMTSDVASAKFIVARASNIVFVMDKWRYHPGINAIRCLLNSRRLGMPLALHLTRISWSTTYNDVDPIWLLAPHDLAIASHILGTTLVPNSASGIIISPRGAEFRAELYSTCGTTINIDISTLRPAYRRMVTLVCTNGSAEFSSDHDGQIIFRSGSSEHGQSTEESVGLPNSMPLMEELRCFLSYLRGGPEPMSTASDGLAIVEVITKLRFLAGLGA